MKWKTYVLLCTPAFWLHWIIISRVWVLLLAPVVIIVLTIFVIALLLPTLVIIVIILLLLIIFIKLLIVLLLLFSVLFLERRRHCFSVFVWLDHVLCLRFFRFLFSFIIVPAPPFHGLRSLLFFLGVLEGCRVLVEGTLASKLFLWRLSFGLLTILIIIAHWWNYLLFNY